MSEFSATETATRIAIDATELEHRYQVARDALEQCQADRDAWISTAKGAASDVIATAKVLHEIVKLTEPGDWPHALTYKRAKQALLIAGDTTPNHCEWFEDDDGWHGSCGKEWEFIDDGPEENGVWFCMNCGKPVHVETVPSSNPCADGHDLVSRGDGTAKCADCGELADVSETGAARSAADAELSTDEKGRETK